MKKLYVLVFGVLAALALTSVVTAQDAQTPEEICAAAVPAADPASRSFTGAEQVLEEGVDYHAIFCTEAGAVYVDLLEDETPITVNNFVFLANSGYYNNTTFHRVIPGFMAQGGDPTATGTGGPGYQFEDEFLPALLFDRPGLLAMANAGAGTNGSQFFLTTVPTPHLNQRHTIFGRVLSGQANVEGIEVRDPGTATEPGTTLQTVVIVTDPTTVAIPENTTPVTQEEVQAGLEQASTLITPDVVDILESITTSFSTQEVIDTVTADNQQAISDLLQEHDYQYRVSGVLNNKACDVAQVPFMSTSYTLDAFATPADAAAALEDGTFDAIAADRGLGEPQTSENLSQPFFTQNITACDQDAIQAATSWQRGPFVVTAEIVVPAENADIVGSIDQVLSQFVGLQIFEPFLMDVLYRDIR
jgi:cyclophilin family peptidyl-prolyl cis-trans isomerase